jgi:hypothetical protein
VTHRVLSVSDDRGQLSLVLKGDANTVPDADRVPVESAERVVWVAPHAGRAIELLTGGPALAVLGAAGLILLLRRRWTVSGVLVVGTTVALVATGATGAVFTDAATVASGAVTSGVVNTPTQPTASQTAGTGAASIGFTSTTVGTLGAPASSYEVYRYAAASGGTGTLVCTTTTTFSCSEARTTLTTGTYYYAVRAKFATNWFAESTRRTYSHDATAPTQLVTRPLAGSSNGAKNLRDGVTANCTSGVACGSAADTGGGTVSSVQYTLLRRATSGGNTTFTCWSGTAWVNSPTGVCTFANATGTTSWVVPGAPTTAYPNPGGNVTHAFVLVVRATDSFGNQSTGTQVDFSL